MAQGAVVGPPALGALMRDTSLDRVGEYRGTVGGRVFLRPVAGGREWEAQPDEVEQADEHAALRAKVAQRNADSREGRL